jgi:hypothetical protein
MGAITVTNNVVFQGQPMDWRVPLATGFAAIGFSLAERVWPQGAEILAWTALLTVILSRTNPKVPSPVESAVAWYNKSGGSK